MPVLSQSSPTWVTATLPNHFPTHPQCPINIATLPRTTDRYALIKAKVLHGPPRAAWPGPDPIWLHLLVHSTYSAAATLPSCCSWKISSTFLPRCLCTGCPLYLGHSSFLQISTWLTPYLLQTFSPVSPSPQVSLFNTAGCPTPWTLQSPFLFCKSMLKSQPPITPNLTLFGNRVIVSVISQDEVILE